MEQAKGFMLEKMEPEFPESCGLAKEFTGER